VDNVNRQNLRFLAEGNIEVAATSSHVTSLPNMNVQAVTLECVAVRLVPLSMEHVPLLWEAAKNDIEDIFRWIPYRMRDHADIQQVVAKALDEQNRGVSLPFATVERRSGTVIGSTRFMNIDAPNRRVEIGSTWIAPEWQRTAVNTEAKYLMLSHAFDQWGCIRVELKTDSLNQKSRNAILRIGAKEEGTLRHHMITHTGRLRDTVYFSIMKFEWPHVRCRLAEKISQGAAAGK
jgi:RimJ/RimL family protein N-acetyltransferase